MTALQTVRDVAIAVGAILTTLTTLTALLWKPVRRRWRAISRRLAQLDTVHGRVRSIEAKVDTVTAKVATVESKIATVEHEVTPNHGGSIKDAVKRLEESSDRQERGQVSLSHDIETARVERMRQIADLAGRLDDHIDRHRS